MAGDCKTELAGNVDAERHLVGCEAVRIVVIGHELADDDTVDHQRDEAQRTDPLVRDDRLELVGFVGLHDVFEKDRARIPLARLPRRMAIDRRAVGIRQAVPAHKAHDAGSIKKQDRGPVAAEAADDGVEGSRIDVVGGVGAVESVGELVEDRLVAQATIDFSLVEVAVSHECRHHVAAAGNRIDTHCARPPGQADQPKRGVSQLVAETTRVSREKLWPLRRRCSKRIGRMRDHLQKPL